jgi:hypothetical protein
MKWSEKEEYTKESYLCNGEPNFARYFCQVASHMFTASIYVYVSFLIDSIHIDQQQRLGERPWGDLGREIATSTGKCKHASERKIIILEEFYLVQLYLLLAFIVYSSALKMDSLKCE